jgi:flagellar basal body L-ring protein FlgH
MDEYDAKLLSIEATNEAELKERMDKFHIDVTQSITCQAKRANRQIKATENKDILSLEKEYEKLKQNLFHYFRSSNAEDMVCINIQTNENWMHL